MFVYTMQLVVQPVVQPFFDNRLYRVNGVLRLPSLSNGGVHVCMYLEEVIDSIVHAKNERSNTDHVGSPRHHDQTQRRHVVNDHLPEVLHRQNQRHTFGLRW